jgi:cell division protein FtsX
VHLLKLALRPWRQAFWSQALSALAVGFLLLLCGVLFWLDHGLGPVLHRMQGEQVVTAYLSADVDPRDEKTIVDSIRIAAGAHAEREPRVKFVDAQGFVDELKDHKHDELARELEDLGAEMTLIVPRYISVSGTFRDSPLPQIQKIPGVESVESSQDRYFHIVGAFKTLRWVLRALIAGIAIALFAGLIHLARINAHVHREALSLLRLWGASAMELKTPPLLSGFLVGLAGGALAAGLWLTLGVQLARQLGALSPMLAGLPAPHLVLAATLTGAGALIGVAAGSRG